MNKRSAGVLLVAGAWALIPVAAAIGGQMTPVPDGKAAVCKYVSTPGANERLQTGQNPIVVSVNSIKANPKDPSWVSIHDPVQVGDVFADAQGHSIVIGLAGYVPDIKDCPGYTPPTETTTSSTTTDDPPTETTTTTTPPETTSSTTTSNTTTSSTTTTIPPTETTTSTPPTETSSTTSTTPSETTSSTTTSSTTTATTPSSTTTTGENSPPPTSSTTTPRGGPINPNPSRTPRTYTGTIRPGIYTTTSTTTAPPVTSSTPTPPNTLAFTGGDVVWPVVWSIVLIALGVLAYTANGPKTVRVERKH